MVRIKEMYLNCPATLRQKQTNFHVADAALTAAASNPCRCAAPKLGSTFLVPGRDGPHHPSKG
jgi:hypothetical protein